MSMKVSVFIPFLYSLTMCLYIISEDEENSPKSCRYVDIINYLNLTQDKDKYIMTRPVNNYRQVTRVFHIMGVEAILDVVSCSG